MNTTDKRNAVSIAAVLALLALFAILSRSAVLTKSATWDETLHAAAGWTYLYAHDYRANPEHPPLTKLVSALLHDPADLIASTKTMAWRAILANLRFQWDWAVRAVYHSPAVGGDDFIQRARLPMLLFGLGLGALVALWAWRIGGPAAAVVATALFALSPDFIGHSSLVTNDVGLAFAWLAVAFTAWQLGERITLARIALLALAVACALLVKFTGLLAAPLAAGLLALRAAEGRAWPAGRTEFSRPVTRGAAALVIVLEIAVVSWAAIWCSYGLRFSATAEETPLNFDLVTTRLVEMRQRAADPSHPPPTAAEVASFSYSAPARFALFCEEHSLLPEAWNWGLLAIEAGTVKRPAYVAGEIVEGGTLFYFPVALLFKEPVAAIVGVLSALALGIVWIRRGAVDPTRHAWLLTCLAVPPAVYAILAVSSRMNIGVRHVFPVYPFVFIATGVVAARAMREYGLPAKRAVVALAALLAIETLAAWPDYIAFFNAPAGGTRGGLRLLGDSNLDWGQDLKLLATWQKANPGETLYLFYNGSADPAGYGITYVNAFGGYAFGPPRAPMTTPGVLAISATNLQGIYTAPELEPMLRELRRTEPMEVLGGTIYLYRFGGAGERR
jgi:hypothetical protein